MSSLNTQAIAEMYNSRSHGYDQSNDSLHVRQTQAYLSHLRPYLYPGASVLDLACGTGLFTLLAKSVVGTQGRVVGIDVSKGMLDIARQKSHEQDLPVEWCQHDISHLDSLNLDLVGKFDVITCASALVLLPSPATAIYNWVKLLKPGGHLMTDVHRPDGNIAMEIFSLIGPDLGEPLKWDMSAFRSQTSLDDLLESAGLEIEQSWETESYGSREYDVQDASPVFEEAVQNPMFAQFGKKETKDKALAEFIRKFKDIGGTRGKIREETRWWMCIGRKSNSKM